MAVLYLLVGSTGCGGNAGFEEGISKLVHRAEKAYFFGNDFHRVSLCLSVSRRFPPCCVVTDLTISLVLSPIVTTVF